MCSSLTIFQHKIQPRSSAERDNSLLLHSALKAASTDTAHRLLDYASLDKMDCEASCILISLANHEPSLTKHNDLEPKKDIKEEVFNDKQIFVQEKKVHVTPTSKTDPIMLLMAAAKVVDDNDFQIEKRKRHDHQRSLDREAYPNGRYYIKQNKNKRIRTSPPSPAPTYKTDPWLKTKEYPDNSFSRQYHSMKQNPKVKQNALHTYITYMIYNDITHGNTRNHHYNNNTSTNTNNNNITTTMTMTTTPPVYNNAQYQRTQQKPSLSSSTSSAATSTTIATVPMENSSPWYHHDDRSILSRPLTAFLWNNETSSVNSLENNRKEIMILPPLSSNTRSSPSISTYDRLPPV